MEDIRSVRMNENERDEFLDRGGTGVISFDTPDDDAPYSRPVSYGYDAETGNLALLKSSASDTFGPVSVSTGRSLSNQVVSSTEDGVPESR